MQRKTRKHPLWRHIHLLELYAYRIQNVSKSIWRFDDFGLWYLVFDIDAKLPIFCTYGWYTQKPSEKTSNTLLKNEILLLTFPYIVYTYSVPPGMGLESYRVVSCRYWAPRRVSGQIWKSMKKWVVLSSCRVGYGVSEGPSAVSCNYGRL